MPSNNKSEIYHTLIHIGCGAAPNLEEYCVVAEKIWLIDADTHALATMDEASQAMPQVHTHHALVDTEERTGTFYRYSLPWANGLTPLDGATQQLYPGLKSLDSDQLTTTPVEVLLTQCLQEEPNATHLLLLDVGSQNENLLQAMEAKGVLGLLQLVLVLPAHRSDQPVNVPPSLHIQTNPPMGLSLPENTQVLTRHPLLQELLHHKALAEDYKQALEQKQKQLVERDQQLAECIQQRDNQVQQIKSAAKERDELKQQRDELSKDLEEVRKQADDAIHQNHLNCEAKNAAEARLEQLLSAYNAQPQKDINISETGNGFYRAFEDKFRGSREEIKRRVTVYLSFVKPVAERYPGVPVLDLGCGRGEWLEVLKEAGIEGEGVDQDAGMLEGAIVQGLSVYHGDALNHLNKQPDSSVLCISLMHVVEHIPFEMIRTIVSEAKRVLIPEGILIMETPNPENYTVGSCNFYMDPTHRNPLPPMLLAFIPEYYGFERVKVLRLQESSVMKSKPCYGLEDFLMGISPDYAVVAQLKQPLKIGNSFDNESEWHDEYGISFADMVKRNAELESSDE